MASTAAGCSFAYSAWLSFAIVVEGSSDLEFGDGKVSSLGACIRTYVVVLSITA